MISELTVIVKDDERILKAKHLIYDKYMVDEEDEIIRKHVEELLGEFCGEPTDISIRISMDIL
jgi:hypothetical protein